MTNEPINGDFYGAYAKLLQAVVPVADRVLPPSPNQSTFLSKGEVDEITRWGNALLRELDQSKRSDAP